MQVASLCRRDVVSVPASATVREAAAAMRNEHVGALAVTDPYRPGCVIGVVTDRDLVVELLAEGRPVDQAIGSLCTTDLSGVAATAPLDEALQVMQRHGVRRLLVLDAGGAVVGMVSADDLLEAVAGELGALAAGLRKGVLREGTRERARSQAGADPPPPLYAARNEP